MIYSTVNLRAGKQAGARILLLALVFFLLGVALSAFWFFRTAKSSPAPVGREPEQQILLSDSTDAVLRRLDSPVDIRFYAVLDRATLPASLVAFAGRVDQLLSAFQREGAGKIRVVRFEGQSDTNATMASRDGIQAFNRDRGDVCYLGLCVTRGEQKELLPRLLPEWEQALESDLSRAIERLAAASPSAASRVAIASQPDVAAIEEVKRLIPNLASVSAEEGTRVLREKAMNEFKSAANETAALLKEAQQRLGEAQSNGSATEQQAAMQQLQQIQTEQAEKIRQIAARSQAQVEAFKQLKGSAPAP